MSRRAIHLPTIKHSALIPANIEAHNEIITWRINLSLRIGWPSESSHKTLTCKMSACRKNTSFKIFLIVTPKEVLTGGAPPILLACHRLYNIWEFSAKSQHAITLSADCNPIVGVISKKGSAGSHPPILSFFWYDTDKNLKRQIFATCISNIIMLVCHQFFLHGVWEWFICQAEKPSQDQTGGIKEYSNRYQGKYLFLAWG